MADADVFSPDEVHLPPPSGSNLFLRSLPSAHTPACHPPRQWWSRRKLEVIISAMIQIEAGVGFQVSSHEHVDINI